MIKKYQCYKDTMGKCRRPRLEKETELLSTCVFKDDTYKPEEVLAVWEKLEKYFEARTILFYGHGTRIVHNGMSTDWHSLQFDGDCGHVEFWNDKITLYFHYDHDNPEEKGWYWTKINKDGSKEHSNGAWNNQVYFWLCEFFDGDKEQYYYSCYDKECEGE